MALVLDEKEGWGSSHEPDKEVAAKTPGDSSRADTTANPDSPNSFARNRKSTAASSDEPPTFGTDILRKGFCSRSQEQYGRYLFLLACISFLLSLCVAIAALVGLLLVEEDQVTLGQIAAGRVILGCGILQAFASLPGCVGAAYHVPAAYLGFVILTTCFGGVEIVASLITMLVSDESASAVFWLSLIAMCLAGLTVLLTTVSMIGVVLKYHQKHRHYSHDKWMNWCDEKASCSMSLAFAISIAIGCPLTILAYQEFSGLSELSQSSSAGVYLTFVGGIFAILGGVLGFFGLLRRSKCIILCCLLLQLVSVIALGTASAVVIFLLEIKSADEAYGYWEAQVVALLTALQAIPLVFSFIMYFTEAEELYLADYV